MRSQGVVGGQCLDLFLGRVLVQRLPVVRCHECLLDARCAVGIAEGGMVEVYTPVDDA